MMTWSSANWAAGIDKVEPPFWWSGMQHPQLQLLIHGDNIAHLDVHTAHQDLIILYTHRGPSNNYLFVDLDLSQASPGIYVLDLIDGEEIIEQITYELKKRSGDLFSKKGFDSSDVLYLITPDRFANGDPANDEVAGLREGLNRSEPYGRHGGDIRGIINHLDYIKDLGFTAIWLNPVLENDQDQWSYHGYATTDYYKVDPRFGSNEEYLELSRRAEAMGIKLIMDMIENHCGSRHWWMEDFPFPDWVNFQDMPYQGTNHRKSTLHDPYVSKIDRTLMTDGWFVPAMPDLNQRNPFMAQYLIQNSIWWIEYARLSGIRQDTYSYPDRDFMSEWTCRIMQEYPYFNIVAEEWTENIPTIAYWLKDKVNHDGYTSCLPSAMDFPLNAVLAKSMMEEEGWNTGFRRIYEILANDFLYPHPEDLVIFPDNHDMSRIFTQVNENINAFKMSVTFIATMRGTPQFYYGTEILMNNPGTTSHGVIRSDFPGGWPGDEVNAFTGKGMHEKALETQQFFQKILTWRKNASALHHGKLMHFIPEEGIYVYFRYSDDHKVMVILNKNTDPFRLGLDRFKEILGEASQGTDILTGKALSLVNEIELPADPVFIIDINP